MITLDQPYAHDSLSQHHSQQALLAQFLDEHSSRFHGLSVTDLSLHSEFSDKQITDWSMLQYKQHFRGIEVFGGELKARFNHNGHITTLNGVLLSPKELALLDVNPKISAEDAKSSCLQVMELLHPEATSWTVELHSGLVVFKHGLTGYSKLSSVHLAFKMIVQTSTPNLLSYEVLVDAHNGEVLSHFSTISHALHRQIQGFDWATQDPTVLNVEWDESNPVNTTNEMYERLLLASKTVYTIFNNLIGFDSFDNNGKCHCLFNDIWLTSRR